MYSKLILPFVYVVYMAGVYMRARVCVSVIKFEFDRNCRSILFTEATLMKRSMWSVFLT